LQNYMKSVYQRKSEDIPQYPLVYYVFDILYRDGFDLRAVPLRDRKNLLQETLTSGEQVRLIDFYEKNGEQVFRAAVKNGLEGVMAKRLDSLYASGKRSDDWQKIKATMSDEFIIGGYSVKSGERAGTLSSLLLGNFNEEGKLIFAGHVGSGFNETNLADLRNRLDALKVSKSPFAEIPQLNAPTTWVKPELVAEVKFSEWTEDHRLRHPVFLRLREDKSPDEVNPATLPVPKNMPKGNEMKNTLAQMQNPLYDFTINVENNAISLTRLDKVLWPATKLHAAYTKRDFLTYLIEVSPYLLPHLKDRPLTMSRYPDGINGEHFWQRHWAHPTPEFIQKVGISDEEGVRSEYLICNNLASLVWLGQAADLELHTWFSRTSPSPDIKGKKDLKALLDMPDFIIFDLDPYIYAGHEAAGEEPDLNREGFKHTAEVAVWLKEILDEMKLKAFVKTSGKTGIHVYVPIIRRLDYTAVRAAAETIAKYLEQKHPEKITTEWRQEKRRGKIFIDFNQNVRGKTLASIYSPRPGPEAGISTPLRWEELGKIYPTDFNFTSLPSRLQKTGDLWADILDAKQELRP
ncbi:MAG: DNA ligase D, partial [Dehalococcoidales bacterium]|nr:DNA ligase D [Dehalococcoidales bacterium]